MSRPSSAAARGLTLAEELEKLEQSITLTLQEIDQNFSRAHRIVTTSILPIVEQYAKHSEAVWEGSKFWKQFFEASANVSLSGYEQTTADESALHDETAAASSALNEDTSHAGGEDGDASATPPYPPGARPPSSHSADPDADSMLSSPTAVHAHSTPRAPRQSADQPPASYADYPSPYEALKREMRGGARSPPQPPANPTTPSRQPPASILSATTPDSSPFGAPPTTSATAPSRPADPLLHRVLDKTYRVAATPHTARKKAPPPPSATAATPATAQRRLDFDSSPLNSSPELAAPQLRADIFSSPMKGAATPRTPGVSVQPGRLPGRYASAGPRRGSLGGGGGGSAAEDVWDSSDEEGEGGNGGLGFSPPKTMQFHVPASKLLQTPAREASRRIVEDILLTAGGDITDDIEGEGGEDSPSVVRRNAELDDSF